jgi:hypothetical protein
MSLDRGVPTRHALGVDFGTVYTVAMARWPDGHTRAILVDGSPLLPSAVYLEPDGHLIAGRDAVYGARLDPARFEPTPKRRIADRSVPLGGRGFPVAELVAAVIDRIAEEWRRTAGPAPTDVTLTCPADWDTHRRQILVDAAGRAGLDDIRLVAEPIAAAAYYIELLGHDVPIGSAVLVHDFGAGGLDVSLVAHGAEGLEVIAVDSRDDISGLDVDATVVEHLRSRHADAAWHRLTEPTSRSERRAQRQLWDDVRVAKERLSRSQAADLVVPLLDIEVHLTRAEFETVAGPILDEAVQVTKRLLRWADLPAEQLTGVFLVGGVSRIPLLATLLHRELGELPVTIEQPELAVAEGGILATALVRPGDPAAPAPAIERCSPSAPTSETAVVPQPVADTAVVPHSSAAETAVGPRPSDPDFVRVPAESLAPPTPAGASAWPSEAAGLNRVPSAAGRAEPPMPPPVDPWPHAEPRMPDPDETVADDGTWRPVDAAARSGRSPRTAPRSPTAVPASDETLVSYRTPAFQRSAAQRTPRRGPAPEPEPKAARRDGSPRTAGARRAPSRPPARGSPQRRPGRFLRFLEILLSIIVLVTVPLAALVLAYSYGTGEPFRDAAIELARGFRDLIRT